MMEWTFRNDGPVAADLALAAGIIEVSLDGGEEILVRLEPLHGDSERAREQIEEAEVSMSGSTLTAHVPKRKRREGDLRLSISIPAGSSVRASTASADVRLRGPAGALEMRTASGDVTVESSCERLNASTASGDVLCASVAGDADVRTASGDVSTESVAGETSVQTASGDVRLGRIHRNARIRTASGDVRIASAAQGDVSVNTVSGDVTLGVDAGVGAWLDLATVSGDTSCTLASEPQGESDAGLRLTCRTVSGDILIRESDRAAH
jgi:DUF4097 and DUF4098 domain-containing protein YvlB